MEKSNKKYLIVFSFFVIGFISCSKDKAQPSPVNDENLYKLVTDTSGQTFYQSGNSLGAAGNSPHGSFKLWFNTKAAAVLNSFGEIPENGIFPDSSLLVKQIYSNSILIQYAVMFKKNGNWLWAEFDPNGNAVYSIGNNGGQCVPCHSQSPNRDLVRTFDLH